jgi:hypothetical protein
LILSGRGRKRGSPDAGQDNGAGRQGADGFWPWLDEAELVARACAAGPRSVTTATGSPALARSGDEVPELARDFGSTAASPEQAATPAPAEQATQGTARVSRSGFGWFSSVCAGLLAFVRRLEMPGRWRGRNNKPSV